MRCGQLSPSFFLMGSTLRVHDRYSERIFSSHCSLFVGKQLYYTGYRKWDVIAKTDWLLSSSSQIIKSTRWHFTPRSMLRVILTVSLIIREARWVVLSNREGNEIQASERAADRAPAAKMNERYEANCEVQHQQRTLLRKFTKTLLRDSYSCWVRIRYDL